LFTIKMPLECCMILMDCSEYMRNGDYVPNRLDAQKDATNWLVDVQINSHAESTVGISAGSNLLMSPTRDVAKILSSIHTSTFAPVTGDIPSAVQVASLALKHRQNKNGSQRIILFVGSPLDHLDDKLLQKAGKQLKKNNIAIDVVVLGQADTNTPKCQILVDAANGRLEDTGERTCHVVTVPTGTLPSDILASSPIVTGGGGGAFAAAAGSGGGQGSNFDDFGGMDPNMDPELAMALRVSMEEERARQERVSAAAAANAGDSAGADEANNETANDPPPMDAEEALLQQALAMSMNENEPTNIMEDAKPAAAAEDQMDVDDDAEMQIALQMSAQQQDEAGASGTAAATGSNEFKDPAFVQELLGSMPGVDPNDPQIQEALRKAAAEKQKGDEDQANQKDQE
jgi:26S proteasome regulatory subunit N10